MQDRALALGAVGLGGTDEFGLGVEVQKGGAGTPSNVAIYFLCQHGIPLHLKTRGRDWRLASNEIRGK